jgi:hypothetical protein
MQLYEMLWHENRWNKKQKRDEHTIYIYNVEQYLSMIKKNIVKYDKLT